MNSLDLLGAVRRASSKTRNRPRQPRQHSPRAIRSFRRVVGGVLFVGSLVSSYLCARSGSPAAMAGAAVVFLAVVIGIFAMSRRRSGGSEPAHEELVEGEEVIHFETVPADDG